jgi:hypothetical protein
MTKAYLCLTLSSTNSVDYYEILYSSYEDKELIEFYNQVTVKIRSEQNYIMLHNLVMQQKH